MLDFQTWQMRKWLCHYLGKLDKKLVNQYMCMLKEYAYDNQGGAAVERQLIDIFVDGLVNDQL